VGAVATGSGVRRVCHAKEKALRSRPWPMFFGETPNCREYTDDFIQGDF
jgi:hypothetical protein